MFQDKYLRVFSLSLLMMFSSVLNAECLTTLDPTTPEETSFVDRITKDLKPKNGNLNGADFPVGEGSTIKLVNENGTPVIRIAKLPDSTIDQIAQGAGFPPNDFLGMTMVKTLIDTGGFQFNATICERGSDYVVNLTGIDQTLGSSGELTLSPNSNGFSIEGNLAGQRVEKGHYVAQ